MIKPTEQTRIEKFFDWSECIDYIEEKHDITIRDYAGKWASSRANKTGERNDNAPYQDYWHFVYELYQFDRDSFFYMDNDVLEDAAAEDWQNEISEMLLSEFGEGEDREIRWWVEW